MHKRDCFFSLPYQSVSQSQKGAVEKDAVKMVTARFCKHAGCSRGAKYTSLFDSLGEVHSRRASGPQRLASGRSLANVAVSQTELGPVSECDAAPRRRAAHE